MFSFLAIIDGNLYEFVTRFHVTCGGIGGGVNCLYISLQCLSHWDGEGLRTSALLYEDARKQPFWGIFWGIAKWCSQLCRRTDFCLTWKTKTNWVQELFAVHMHVLERNGYPRAGSQKQFFCIEPKRSLRQKTSRQLQGVFAWLSSWMGVGEKDLMKLKWHFRKNTVQGCLKFELISG